MCIRDRVDGGGGAEGRDVGVVLGGWIRGAWIGRLRERVYGRLYGRVDQGLGFGFRVWGLGFRKGSCGSRVAGGEQGCAESTHDRTAPQT
eukprot:1455638-Rhodomonas_salina.1